MKTKYLEIETICIELDSVTIAAEITLYGLNYSEPAYTNIFCDKTQLIDLMLIESSELSSQVLKRISIGEQNENGIIQIDLADFNENKSWSPDLSFKLKPIESEDFQFACYDLIAFSRKIIMT